MRAGKTSLWVLTLGLTVVTLNGCSGGGEGSAPTTIAAVNDDSNSVAIPTQDWDRKEEFCEKMNEAVSLPPSPTVGEVPVYLAAYGEKLREANDLGPRDNSFVANMSTVLWALEQMEQVAASEVVTLAPPEEQFTILYEQNVRVGESPGVGAARGRMEDFIQRSCGLGLSRPAGGVTDQYSESTSTPFGDEQIGDEQIEMRRADPLPPSP